MEKYLQVVNIILFFKVAKKLCRHKKNDWKRSSFNDLFLATFFFGCNLSNSILRGSIQGLTIEFNQNFCIPLKTIATILSMCLKFSIYQQQREIAMSSNDRKLEDRKVTSGFLVGCMTIVVIVFFKIFFDEISLYLLTVSLRLFKFNHMPINRRPEQTEQKLRCFMK